MPLAHRDPANHPMTRVQTQHSSHSPPTKRKKKEKKNVKTKELSAVGVLREKSGIIVVQNNTDTKRQ
jgi:hypothetical protein